MVYPAEDLVIRARMAIKEAQDLVECVRKTHQRSREIRERRLGRPEERGEPPPAPKSGPGAE